MTIQPLSTLHATLWALAAAFGVALAVYRARLLTLGGAAAAAIIGAVIFVGGGLGGAAALLTFFITSNLLGRFQKARKSRLGFEKGGRRDAWQVLANGGLAALLVALACVPHFPSAILRIAFLAALAEANADTWATEIGAGFGWTPRSIISFRPAFPGESGAVSLPGTLAALAGAALIGAFAIRLHDLSAGITVTLCGFAGALIDSILGATLQAQYTVEPSSETLSPLSNRLTELRSSTARLARGVPGVGNDLVNFLATIAAAAAAALLRYSIH